MIYHFLCNMHKVIPLAVEHIIRTKRQKEMVPLVNFASLRSIQDYFYSNGNIILI